MEHSKITEYQRELAGKFLLLPFSSIAYNKTRLAEFRALSVSLGLEVDMECVKCIPDLKVEIKKIMAKTDTKKVKKARKFLMKPGIYVTCLGRKTDNDSLTDEDAVKILKQSKGHISFFAKYPKNWEELV